MNLDKRRIDYIDLAKGLCICMVVYHHIIMSIEGMGTIFDNALLSMRMPLYYLLSGLFFKTYGCYLNFVVKKINKLLIPFISFHFITAVLWMGITDIIGNRFCVERCLYHLQVFILGPYKETFPNGVIWFLLSLFIVNIMFYLCLTFSRKTTRPASVLILLTILTGIGGFLLGKMRIDLPLYIDSSMSAFPFFVAGYFIRNKTQFLYTNKYDKYNYLFCIAFALLCFFLVTSTASFIINYYGSLNLFQLYVGSLSGIISILLFCKQIGRIPLISYWGRYSIIILVTHSFLYPYIWRLIGRIGYQDSMTAYLTFACTMLSYLLIIPVFCKVFPYFTAQKDLIKV